jgi:hypothetical protein
VQYLFIPEPEHERAASSPSDACVTDEKWFFMRGCLDIIPVHGREDSSRLGSNFREGRQTPRDRLGQSLWSDLRDLEHRYDFFVSYKHERYRHPASHLTAIARERGYSVWLDRDHPPPDTSEEALLKHILNALRASYYVLFFETYAKAAQANVMAAGGGSIPVKLGSWQERELAMTDRRRLVVLHHRDPSGSLTLGQTAARHAYHDLEDAFDTIELAVKNPYDYF